MLLIGTKKVNHYIVAITKRLYLKNETFFKINYLKVIKTSLKFKENLKRNFNFLYKVFKQA